VTETDTGRKFISFVNALIINHFPINKTRVKWRAIIIVIFTFIRTAKKNSQYSKHHAVQGLHSLIMQYNVHSSPRWYIFIVKKDA